jgi:glycosyltransferase involved in cell wall biosynthesis
MSLSPLSAIVLTFNSARTLPAVLRSLNWCEEILVVDSGSTDQSREIATSMGATVIERKFNGFGEQKNFAVTAARFDWVFIVDSDEVVTHELQSEVQTLFEIGHGEVIGYRVPVRLVFLGKILYHCGNSIKHPVRLFNRKHGNVNLSKVHEAVEVIGPRAGLKNALQHFSYLNLHDYFHKFNHYTTLAAQEMHASNKPEKNYRIWLGLPACFVKMYGLKLGFLDGYHGFVWCLISSLYPVVKYAKLKDLHRNDVNQAQVTQTEERA